MSDQILTHYKILAKLGQGGMGEVYLAEDTKLRRKVALKLLPSHFAADPDARARFEQEARAAAALNHPNICTIYEIGEAEDKFFIAMEYIEGEELKKKVISDQLSVNSVIDIAAQIVEGLKAAHAKGITHRDIKSSNIMVTESGQVKIMDFGLAKMGGEVHLTKAGMTLGTAAYMSPEQARGEVVDHRTDIWSLGVVLYEMLTGQLPFRGEYEAAMMYSILNEDPQPLTALRTGVPMELERIVNKALAKKAEERYQHIDEVLADLRLIQKDFSAGASKRRLTEVKSFKKKRFYLYGGVATVLAVLIGITLFRGAHETHAIHDSIAVLPLASLSGDPEQEYFTDGMTGALITDLAKISALKVISRTSVMQYKGAKKPLPEIARELQVDVILEGSVLRSGDRVRVTAQLIEAATDRHLWAKSYDHDLRDILTLQSEVAQAVVNEIKIKLTPREQARLTKTRVVNLGCNYAFKGMYAEAIAASDKAISLVESLADTTNELLLGQIAYVYAVSGNQPQARRLLNKIIELSKQGYVDHYNTAMACAGLGEKDLTFEYLAKAYKERSPSMVFLKIEPFLDNLRSDSRYTELLRKVGLEK